MITDFFGFGKPGYDTNDGVVSNPNKPLGEEDLTTRDIDYIRASRTAILRKLGKKLDQDHNLVFYQKAEAGFGKAVKYVNYKGDLYNMKELSKISGISLSTIYNRINQYKWSVEKAVDTPLKNNSKFNTNH